MINLNGSLADVKGKGTVVAFINDVNAIERVYNRFHVFCLFQAAMSTLMSVSRAKPYNTYICKQVPRYSTKHIELL